MSAQNVFLALAKMHKQNTGKNLIGQCIQNDGNEFRILGTDKETGKPVVVEYTAVNWDSKTGIKKQLDTDAKKAGTTITWPRLFESMGLSQDETDLGRLYIAYAVRMLVGKLSIQNIVNAEALSQGFAKENGEFDESAWDSWAKENKYTCLITKKGKVVSEFVPSGKLLKHLIEVSKELNKLANYHSIDSVRDRQTPDFDVSSFTL